MQGGDKNCRFSKKIGDIDANHEDIESMVFQELKEEIYHRRLEETTRDSNYIIEGAFILH